MRFGAGQVLPIDERGRLIEQGLGAPEACRVIALSGVGGRPALVVDSRRRPDGHAEKRKRHDPDNDDEAVLAAHEAVIPAAG